MSRDLTLELQSIRDGKASIEHQIDIHVNDLFGVKENQQLSLEDVLAGLRYVMDYRLKGGRLPNLELDLMKRLCEGLLLNMSYSEGGLLKRKMTTEANEAFILFGEFLEEVEEFRTAVGEKNISDLYNALKLHRRCRKDADPEVKQAAVAIIYMLTEWFPQFSDWHELVKEEEQSDVDKVIKELTDTIKKPKMPPLQGVALPPPSLYFDRDVTRLLKMFRTSLTDGLSSTLIEGLLNHYGPNKLPEPPKPSIFMMILNQLKDFMVLILLAATVVSAAKKDFKGMSVLLFVIVLNTIIGFIQEYKANKALEALQKLTVPKAQVIRDGEQTIVDSFQLVPGDIVVLDEGDAVPADVRIVESSHLQVIESILTGESLPVHKTVKKIWTSTRNLPLGDCKGNAFMSTVVAKGRGKGLVVRTGYDTEVGKISAAITSVPKTKTPIQRKLNRLGQWLVVIAILLCILIVVIGIVYKHNVGDMITIGITLAVSVIPEGLVAVTTVTMAIGVRRMAKRSAIVRTLPAVETLGSVTVICSDKTGTLTEGKMGPSEMWTADDSLYSFTEPASLDPNVGGILFLSKEYRNIILKKSRTSSNSLALSEKIDQKALKPQKIPKSSSNPPVHMMTALMISSLCNNSSVTKDDDGEWKGIGDPTEVALVLAAQKGGFAKNYWERERGFTKVHEKPFDSERKLMSVVYKITNPNISAEHLNLVMAKGAPEALLRKCTHHLPSVETSSTIDPLNAILGQQEGFQLKELNDDFIDHVSEQSSRMASQGLRVLGLAFKSVSMSDCFSITTSSEDAIVGDSNESEENPASPTVNPLFAEDNLTFVGLIGLIDPPKKSVAESVRKCKKAGIKVVMITGDHVATATAIATDIGIIVPDEPNMNRAIRGAELDLLSDEAIAELDPFPNVFARVSPDNKLKIVKALQNMGNSVAMTGDGVNDAPAIKAADVGVAMGISGTEITKQAADIILANDDFSTIVAAVEEGRQVFDNILKFIVYLLSCNGAEIILMLLCAAINIELPFTTIMILWANIIADVPPAISLGVEPAEKDIMQRKPRSPSAPVLSKIATTILFMQSFTMALLPFGVYMLAMNQQHIEPEKKVEDARSLAFTTLISMQLFQGFLSRTLNESLIKTGIFGNKWMFGSVFGSILLMLIGVYVPGINKWLQLTPVPPFGWVKIVICCIIQLVVSEIGKALGRRYRDSQ
ncbi:13829_t:CDS:10 [Funneliformis mosseae]|uniref:13829_t:CDS:1 n=1 Tax=Funneliformis mosseae TaxID=27381 RepID=A0A9N9ERF7_FUNMO|nr:13829_t:CDS:10 [Funneliformis mosseae]